VKKLFKNLCEPSNEVHLAMVGITHVIRDNFAYSLRNFFHCGLCVKQKRVHAELGKVCAKPAENGAVWLFRISLCHFP